jgi:hypothetical protein
MSSFTQAQLLADTLDKARSLTKWYLSLLRDTDMKHTFELNDIKLNSPLWIAAHLAWAENMLILQSTGGDAFKIDWLEKVTLGSPHDASLLPDTKEVLSTMKNIHEVSMNHLATLSDATLDEPNLTGISFGTDTKRSIIQHAIRHEATHVGQLGWICKLNNIPTI